MSGRPDSAASDGDMDLGPDLRLDVFIHEALSKFGDGVKEEVKEEIHGNVETIKEKIRVKIEDELDDMLINSKFGARLDNVERAIKAVRQEIQSNVIKADDNVLKDLQRDIDSVQSEVKALKAGEVTENSSKIVELEAALKEHERLISQNSSRLAKIEPLVHNPDPNADDPLDGIKARITRLEEQIIAVKGTKEIKQQVNLLESRLGDLRKEFGEVKEKCDEVNVHMGTLAQNQTDTFAAIQMLKAEDEKLAAGLEKAEDGIKKNSEFIAKANNELDHTRQLVEDMQATLKRDMLIKLEIQQKIQSFHHDLDAVSTRVQGLEQHLATEVADNLKVLTAVRQELDDLKAKLGELKGEIRLGDLKDTLEKLEKDFRELDAETRKNTKKFAMLRKGFNTAVNESGDDPKVAAKLAPLEKTHIGNAKK